MPDPDPAPRSPPPAPPHLRRPLPQGYRQGIITAITVLLGFSLSFLRYWSFVAPGEWTLQSVLPAGTLVVAIILQIIVLYRSLQVADDDETHYQRTGRWFIAAAAILVGALGVAGQGGDM